jgi:hypothetical protein
MTQKMKLKCLSLLIILILDCTACSKDRKSFADGYDDKNKLIQDFTGAIMHNDREKVTKLLVHKNEYRELIHPYVPESNMKKGGMLADDFWDTLIIRRRDAAIDSYLRLFKNANCKLDEIGSTKDILKFPGSVTFYKQISITYSCLLKDGTRSVESDRGLLGVIAEKNKKYKVLNVFDD